MANQRYFEPDVELMSRPELQAQQVVRLLEVLPYAYDKSALIRTVWDEARVHPRDIGTMADFVEKVPFITKDAVRRFRDRTGDPFGGLLCVPRSELSAIMCSSGTTGEPTFFAERFPSWSPLQTGRLRDLWEHGLRPGDHAIPAPNAIRGASAHDLRQLGAIPVAVDAGPGNWREVLAAVDRYDVRYLVLLGPSMNEIDSLSEELDMRQALASVTFASFAGEPLGVRLTNKVRQDWDTRLAMWTSAGDTGTAWECREHDGYHLWEDTVIPECLEPGGSEPVADGEIGELVVTDIDNAVGPLIRYRSDDLVRLTRSQCRCGRHHARIWPLGRACDRTVVSGRSVLPAEIWAVVEREDETRSALFQIVRATDEMDELRVRVGYSTSRTGDVEDVRRRLTDGITDSLGVHTVVEMVDEREIVQRASSAAKIPRVVSS